VPNGAHVLDAVACDAAGNCSTSARRTITVNNTGTSFDLQAPSVPADLSAVAVSSTRIDLSWSAATDDVRVAGYRVYTAGGQIATVAGTSYSDTRVTPSTAYTYTVAAFDAAGNASARSASASATTPSGDTTSPAVSITSPVNDAKVKSPVQVSLSCSDDVGVTRVELWGDGGLVAAKDFSPAIPAGQTAMVSLSWDASSGRHTIQARALDAAGNTGASVSIDINVTRRKH
jgi:chitodextrinase